MSNIAIVYKTKYGSTKKYAQWLQEALNADLFKCSDIRIEKLKNYDTIIYGGGLYAGGILGFSFMQKNYDKIKDKNIIVFAVGASTHTEKAVREISEHNLTQEMENNIKVFFLRGGLNYKKMNPIDRFLMFMLKKVSEKKTSDDNDTKGLLATYGKTVDFTNKKAIEPIVNLVQN